MARRSDHTREELTAMALEASRDIVERGGLSALTARAIAAEIGYSPGTLYNLFDDLDDLIVHLNGETLDRLYETLADEGPNTYEEKSAASSSTRRPQDQSTS